MATKDRDDSVATMPERDENTIDPVTFDDGEDVLSSHGPGLYNARIIKWANSEDHPGRREYRIHYAKWNKKWDEWVLSDRLLKVTDSNLRLQKQKEAAIRELLGKGKIEKKPKESSVTTKTSVAKKRKHAEIGIEDPETAAARDELAIIPMPVPLKSLLIADWEAICKKKHSLTIPCSINVDTILDRYIDSKTREQARQKETVEVINGVRVYFERALATRLLYDIERPQYEQVTSQHKGNSLTHLYGINHLLRLFVILPSLMAHTDMDPTHRSTLQQQLTELLKYLSKHLSDFTASEYTDAVVTTTTTMAAAAPAAT